MATKNNIRSIRFSDELAELIDRQIGDTFTQKLRSRSKRSGNGSTGSNEQRNNSDSWRTT